VIGFKDGVGVERVVGFEGLGERGFDGTDSGFSVGVFERRMVVKGVFVGVKVGDENGIDGGGDDSGDESEDERRNRGRNGGRKSIRSGKIRRDEEDDDDDWD
jgi:hypothetical protein